MAKRTFRRRGSLIAAGLFGLFGLFIGLIGIAVMSKGIDENVVFMWSLGGLGMVVPWLSLYRPRLQFDSRGVIVTWMFGWTRVPYAQLKRIVIPPESPGMVVIANDDKEFPVFAFGSSMISRWMGNRREKEILQIAATYREEAKIAGIDVSEEISTGLNALPIVLPILLLIIMISCVVIAAQ